MHTRIGIVGAGGIGNMHADAVVRGGSVVAGAWDVDFGRAQHLCGRFPGAEACASLDELLARDDVHGVVVAVPNRFHAEVALAAMAAGKDVLLEKPMAMTIAECDAIVRAARAGGRVVQMGFVSRCAPNVHAARAFVDAGELGRPYHARAQWYRRRGIPGLGGWFTTKAMAGGGALIDLGVHSIDLVLHLCGNPEPRRASGVCTSVFGPRMGDYVHTEMWAGPPRLDGVFDVEDGVCALVRCDGGFTLELTITWAANVDESIHPTGIQILGERGGIWLEAFGGRVRFATERGRQLRDETPHVVPGHAWDMAWAEQHRRFGDAIRSRDDSWAPPEQGRAVQRIVEAIYRSAAAGHEVEV